MLKIPEPEQRPTTWAELRGIANHTRVALVGMAQRIGFCSFLVFLEYRYFPPGTPMNSFFWLAHMEFGGMKWIVCIIPKKHLAKADALAKLLGLRRADGFPHLISHAGVEKFPLDGDNVFTMENIAGHFVYQNNPELEKKAREFELRAIEGEVDEYYARYQANVIRL